MSYLDFGGKSIVYAHRLAVPMIPLLPSHRKGWLLSGEESLHWKSLICVLLSKPLSMRSVDENC